MDLHAGCAALSWEGDISFEKRYDWLTSFAETLPPDDTPAFPQTSSRLKL